jgi:hypothetical protein
MTPWKTLAAAAAGLTAGAVVVMRRCQARPDDPATADRWLTVTINRAPGDIQPDKLPPLGEYATGSRRGSPSHPATGAWNWPYA